MEFYRRVFDGKYLNSGHSFLTLLNHLLVTGIHGVLDAYRMCVSQIALHGPTNFAPIILHVAQFAAAAKKDHNAKVGSCMMLLGFKTTMPRWVVV